MGSFKDTRKKISGKSVASLNKAESESSSPDKIHFNGKMYVKLKDEPSVYALAQAEVLSGEAMSSGSEAGSAGSGNGSALRRRPRDMANARAHAVLEQNNANRKPIEIVHLDSDEEVEPPTYRSSEFKFKGLEVFEHIDNFEL